MVRTVCRGIAHRLHAVADLDVLVAGAGPTGLARAVQLRMLGARFRIVDELVLHLDLAARPASG